MIYSDVIELSKSAYLKPRRHIEGIGLLNFNIDLQRIAKI